MFEEIFWWIACVTTGLFALRLLLMIIGGDAHADAGLDLDVNADGALDLHAAGHDVEVISFTGFLTFVMMGSWTTLVAYQSAGLNELQSVGAGLICGVISAYAIAWLLSRVKRLQADGMLRDFDATGLRGTAYVMIPKAGAGEGQIRLEVKGRLRTFRAVSDGTEIASFRPVVVTSMTSDHVMRVRPAE